MKLKSAGAGKERRATGTAVPLSRAADRETAARCNQIFPRLLLTL